MFGGEARRRPPRYVICPRYMPVIPGYLLILWSTYPAEWPLPLKGRNRIARIARNVARENFIISIEYASRVDIYSSPTILHEVPNHISINIAPSVHLSRDAPSPSNPSLLGITAG